MDIHKPKPWHSIREFLKEYVIIVVGVLTALAAEQGVEWLHWRHEVSQAHANLKDELQRNARSLRYRFDRGHLRDEPALRIRRVGEGGPKPVLIREAGFPPLGDSVWEVVKSGQVATHLTLDERVAYSRLYTAIANEMFVLAEVRKAAGQLYRYEDAAHLAPGDADRLAGDVSEMRAVLDIHRGNADPLFKQVAALGGAPGPMGDGGRIRLAKLCGNDVPAN